MIQLRMFLYCRGCGNFKTPDDFHVAKDKSTGRQSLCRPCMLGATKRVRDGLGEDGREREARKHKIRRVRREGRAA